MDAPPRARRSPTRLSPSKAPGKTSSRDDARPTAVVAPAAQPPPSPTSNPDRDMNPSRIFIERPVATSLLMVAIMLVGAIAYRFLPLSAC